MATRSRKSSGVWRAETRWVALLALAATAGILLGVWVNG